MFGYTWASLHAAVNDLPTALLVVGFLFDILYLLTRRESLRWAGFWMILAGSVGGLLAVLSGLQAADHIAHSEAVHEIMSEHKTLAFITLGIFAAVSIWRIVRERKMARGERGLMELLSLAGVVFVCATAWHGGEMVFRHAAGVPTPALQQEIEGRAEGHHHHDGDHDEHEHDDHDHTAPAGDHAD
jgi:uncharacterized membrane protein